MGERLADSAQVSAFSFILCLPFSPIVSTHEKVMHHQRAFRKSPNALRPESHSTAAKTNPGHHFLTQGSLKSGPIMPVLSPESSFANTKVSIRKGIQANERLRERNRQKFPKKI